MQNTNFVFQAARSFHDDGDWTELAEERNRQLAEDDEVLMYDTGCVLSVCDLDGLIVSLNDFREHMRRGVSWERVLPD
jgi:hypothetical protein